MQEEQKQAAEDQARQAEAAMANMNVYQPPAQFMQQYNDPSFFNHELAKYKAHLAQDADSVEAQTPQLGHLASQDSSVSDDRN